MLGGKKQITQVCDKSSCNNTPFEITVGSIDHIFCCEKGFQTSLRQFQEHVGQQDIEELDIRVPITAVIEKTATGYICYTEEVHGLTASGSTIEELKRDYNQSIKFECDWRNELEESNRWSPDDFIINWVE